MAVGADNRIIPVILSGGAGTRLWPLSRELYPKQLLPLIGDDSLLHDTARRVADGDRYGPPIIVCNQAHRFLVAEQMRAADISPAAIVLEPAGRNTAPATAVAAHLALRDGEGALILVLPSDHHMARPAALADAVARGRPAAEGGALVTFGITPEGPETGYGYLRRGQALGGADGVCRLDRFVEKPDLAAAEAMLAEGGHLWNAGIFLFPGAALPRRVGTVGAGDRRGGAIRRRWRPPGRRLPAAGGKRLPRRPRQVDRLRGHGTHGKRRGRRDRPRLERSRHLVVALEPRRQGFRRQRADRRCPGRGRGRQLHSDDGPAGRRNRHPRHGDHRHRRRRPCCADGQGPGRARHRGPI